jgi:hypothetical protein
MESHSLSLLSQALVEALSAATTSPLHPTTILLCSQGHSLEAHKATTLAALSEGLDYIADSILVVLANKRGGQLPQPLVKLGQRFRSLSGLVARALRLEMHIQVRTLLQPLFQANHVLDGPEDAKELHPCE